MARISFASGSALAAIDPHQYLAQDAADAIRVDYEVLPFASTLNGSCTSVCPVM